MRSSISRVTLFLLAGFIFASSAAFAQSPPATLPTAPGAHRAVEGGLTGAAASLPGGYGESPLEPYLITLLLPVFGLLIAILAVTIDKQMRSHGARGR
ncbi:MAG: hypothetical protein IAI49_03285 [Candidatus Eremiobacteraeota bacterium]|nr:hypothetical protein [Candidatus Eremiobacteraeota bacterium]